MDTILTLMADPERADLSPALTDAVRRALDALGAEAGPPDWLAPGTACDIGLSGLDADQADAAVGAALTGRPIDRIVQPAADRRKRLLIADMESTLIRQEMLDELADMAGLRDRVAAITWRAMNGEIDFATALAERVALLAGLPAVALERCAERITLMPGAGTLGATMKAAGAYCALVSGGFRSFTRLVAARLGFDEDMGNTLDVAAGPDGTPVLTGRVLPPVLDRDAKLAALLRLAGDRHIPLRATLAVGDGANDLPMIQAAGLGIAFRAKPAVAAAARARLHHGDLTALLYAQGFRRDEFTTGAV
jgi:phosphoserine phosphatase